MFGGVLEQVVENPERRLSRLVVAAPGDREIVLAGACVLRSAMGIELAMVQPPRCLLVNVTETKNEADLDRYAASLGAVLGAA